MWPSQGIPPQPAQPQQSWIYNQPAYQPTYQPAPIGNSNVTTTGSMCYKNQDPMHFRLSHAPIVSPSIGKRNSLVEDREKAFLLKNSNIDPFKGM